MENLVEGHFRGNLGDSLVRGYVYKEMGYSENVEWYLQKENWMRWSIGFEKVVCLNEPLQKTTASHQLRHHE